MQVELFDGTIDEIWIDGRNLILLFNIALA